ncbi:MAG: hypothetical protein NWE76_08885, partial [Candidatus Bathyarchaeota archaeon]|nr:hypothetical protein [Candidatus Bathyarchaeota archaeon]
TSVQTIKWPRAAAARSVPLLALRTLRKNEDPYPSRYTAGDPNAMLTSYPDWISPVFLRRPRGSRQCHGAFWPALCRLDAVLFIRAVKFSSPRSIDYQFITLFLKNRFSSQYVCFEQNPKALSQPSKVVNEGMLSDVPYLLDSKSSVFPALRNQRRHLSLLE